MLQEYTCAQLGVYNTLGHNFSDSCRKCWQIALHAGENSLNWDDSIVCVSQTCFHSLKLLVGRCMKAHESPAN